jgi:uncharacterized membrane protein YfcA
MTFESVLIVLGALAGGFVSGLTGFGTGLAGLPFWLAATPPVVAAQLAAACGATGQAQTIPLIWRHIRWARALPLVLGGVVGVPFGTVLLPHISVPTFKLLVGAILIIYCAFMLVAGPRPRASWSSPWLDAAVGVGGGVLAGVAGLSGPIPVIYASLLGWTKDERRGVFLVFNGSILILALVSSAVAGLASAAFGWALLLAVPGTLVGVALGLRLYRRLDDRRFDRFVLSLLLASGVVLVVASQAGGPP